MLLPVKGAENIPGTWCTNDSNLDITKRLCKLHRKNSNPRPQWQKHREKRYKLGDVKVILSMSIPWSLKES